ncbi:AGAP003446-PA-like protein [Anopheles sinensis]|uniref:AGAP003446-PA-like protein n=1 Tax=Anopheles sinensis TaxID=74873 RepID=A0A084WSU0_ANOSI|nr:AGAP003446-PA-like protein [Anopheles sinensis]
MDSEPEPEPEVADDPVDVPNQNPESYCRFCFSETDVEPLFPANQSKPAEEMYERLFECIGIRLTKEDYYPSGICWHCSLTMEEFQCFRKRCLKYDALVRRLQGGVKDTEPSPTIEAKDPQPSEEKQSIKLPGVIFRKGKKFKKKPLPTGDATVHPCPFCPRSFTRKMYFDQHMWKHRDLLQAAKAEGAGGGIKKTLLNRPIKQEKPWIPIAKPEASASTDNGSLVATGGKLKDASISCEYCPRKFTRRMYYMQHLRKHNAVKEGVVRCRYCPRNFVSTRSRRAHEKKDHYKIIAAENAGSKKPPFCCPQCSRTFKYRYSLRMHLLNHSGQLPHACDICNCRFYSMQYLAVHKKRYHGPDAICGEAGNESIISCLYCTRSFLRECDRSSHIKQMHGNIVSALNETEGDGQPELMDDCPPADTEGLTDPELLPPNVHEPMMEIKEEEPYANDPHRSGLPSGGMEPDNPLFYCYSCAMNFETEDMYAEHLDDQHPFGGEQMMEQLQSGSPTGEQEQGEKEFRCPYCPKTFTRKWSMNEHITSHLGTRRYPCELCPAIFCREGYLRTHRSRKHPNEAEKYNGTFKCRFCPRMFVMERYKKVHEKIAHIKKGGRPAGR